MSGTFRPIYPDESVILSWDKTSQWALAASPSITASNFESIAGAVVWSVQIPGSITALVGTLSVQVNNSNPIYRSDVSGISWTVNPLQNQPSEGKRVRAAINPSFTANWTTVGTVGGASVAQSITAFTIPARYVRLLGVGVTALTTTPAFVWSDGMSQGN